MLKVEGEGEGYSSFCIKCPLYGCDLLDNRISRLHTNFQVSATLSKKVGVEVDKIWGKRTFLLRIAET